MKLQFDFVKDAQQGIIEMDVFTRLLKGEIYDTEEVRKESPSDYSNGFEYVGVALSGSSIYDPVWNCCRCTWESFKKTRIQFRKNISWDQKDLGWN